MGTSSSMPETVFYVFGIILSLGFFAFNYRLALHPLRKYPGPFLARLTDGYGGYHAMKKRLHLVTYIDHLKYGPVFRQAPNRLVFNTSTALRGAEMQFFFYQLEC